MKKQITVKERNSWERETFNYVIYVTPEEASQIREKCEKYGDGSLTVQESNYTDEEIKKMNTASSNGYMDFIAPYRLNDKAVENWEEFGDCFYKGVGLTKLKALANER
jgi:hypothetical protein